MAINEPINRSPAERIRRDPEAESELRIASIGSTSARVGVATGGSLEVSTGAGSAGADRKLRLRSRKGQPVKCCTGFGCSQLN